MLRYPQSIYYRRELQLFSTNVVNFLLLAITLLTICYYSLNQSNSEKFLYFMKNLLNFLAQFLSQIHNMFQFTFFILYVYVQEVFYLSRKHFTYQFVTEHYIKLPQVQNPRFNSSVCCQLLILSYHFFLFLFFFCILNLKCCFIHCD